MACMKYISNKTHCALYTNNVLLIPASSIHSHQSLYNSAQHQPNRSSIICEPVPSGMDQSFHLTASSSQENLTTENVSRFGFDYAANSTEEDELLDVIAKWQET